MDRYIDKTKIESYNITLRIVSDIKYELTNIYYVGGKKQSEEYMIKTFNLFLDTKGEEPVLYNSPKVDILMNSGRIETIIFLDDSFLINWVSENLAPINFLPIDNRR